MKVFVRNMGGTPIVVDVGTILSFTAPQGRLTLTSFVPVLTSTVSAATTVYYTAYAGRHVSVFNGTQFEMFDTGGQLSLALDSDSGHTGYHQSGKNFDVFYANVAGTFYFGTGPAWTSDTVRSVALSRTWFLVNDASMTLRHGTASGDTVTVPAGQGTYLGTFRASANGQTEYIFGAIAAGGTAASLLLWNAYNRVLVSTMVGDSTNTWTRTANTTGPANASNTMRVSFVSGLEDDEFYENYACSCFGSGGGSVGVGIGVDSTTTLTGRKAFNASTGSVTVFGDHNQRFLGFHFLQAMEWALTGTGNFAGDGGAPTLIQNGLYFRALM